MQAFPSLNDYTLPYPNCGADILAYPDPREVPAGLHYAGFQYKAQAHCKCAERYFIAHFEVDSQNVLALKAITYRPCPALPLPGYLDQPQAYFFDTEAEYIAAPKPAPKPTQTHLF